MKLALDTNRVSVQGETLKSYVPIVIFQNPINQGQKLHWPTSMSSSSATTFEREFPVNFPIDHVIFFKPRDINSCSFSVLPVARQRLGISTK